jgi:UrcA family protein
MNKLIDLASVAALALAVASPAMASEPGFQTEEVFVGDLDLASEGGRKAMETRVRAAVKKVCPYQAGARIRETVQCRRETLVKVNGQMEAAVAAYNLRRETRMAAR